MANNRLTQESPHLNRDVFLDIRLFFIKYVNIVWKIICCKTLLQIGRRGMSAVFDTLLVFFVWIGATFAFFHSDGKMPCVRQDLKIILRDLQMDLSHNWSKKILILLSLWALFESGLLILICSTKKSTSESDFSVIKGKSDSNVLPLSINELCFPKKELKILLFSLKSVINLLSCKCGAIQGIILHLGLVDGSDNFFFFLRFSYSTQIEESWLNFVI